MTTTLWAVSDLHAAVKRNGPKIDAIQPVDPSDWLIVAGDVAELVAHLVDEGKARESIRKSVTALAMVLDFAEISPNPARDRVKVKLPLEEPEEPEPPSAQRRCREPTGCRSRRALGGPNGKSSSRSGLRHHNTMATSTATWTSGEIP